MSHYKDALDYIKSVLDQDPEVKTATKGLLFDVNKSNDFPLVHVVVVGSNIGDEGSTINFTFTIMSTALRKVENTAQGPDRWEINDNEDENLDLTHDILVRFHQRITSLGGDFNVFETTAIIPIIEERTNVVDGWQFDITIEQPNDINVC